MRSIINLENETSPAPVLLSPDEEETRDLAPDASRMYAGAKVTRLDKDLGEVGEVNRSLYENLNILRARSRQLAMDDVYITRFLNLTVTETIGSKGLKLSVRGPDEKANKIIEEEYKEWGKSCCTSGDMSLLELEQVAVRTRHRDGEFFARIVENYKDNKYGYALFAFDADRLELGFDRMPNAAGDYILNAIEYNKWGKPLAYHILERHPGENVARWPDGQYRMRIPAREIIHYYEVLRPGQKRGIPSCHAAIVNAKHLNAYIKATIVAARVIASKFAAITSKELDPHLQNTGLVKTKTAEIMNKVEAGRIWRLQPGESMEVFDPKQPSGQHKPFSTQILQGLAVGLNMGYSSISGDLSGTSFASGRLGALQINEYWDLQRTNFTTRFKIRNYAAWLRWAYLTNDRIFNAFKPAELETYVSSVVVYDKPVIWIDPDATSKVIERNINTGITTRHKELAKLNIDYDEHLAEVTQEAADFKNINPEAKNDNQVDRPLEVVKDKQSLN